MSKSKKKLFRPKVLASFEHRYDDYPYPIHDWTEKNKYEKTLTSKEWAWEFLRRNKDYQYDFDRFINKENFPEFRVIINDNHISLKQQKRDSQHLVYFGFTTSSIDDWSKTMNQYSLAYRHVELDNKRVIPLKEAILEKFNISSCSRLLNPKENLPDNSFFGKENTSFIDKSWFNTDESLDSQFSLAPRIPENIVFRLSADVDINKQLAMVKNVLLNHRKHLGLPAPKSSPRKANNGVYNNYIRILDAIATTPKPTSKEIGSEMYPDDFINPKFNIFDKVSTTKTSAQSMSAEKYLKLLY